jgi:hypothetical protein
VRQGSRALEVVICIPADGHCGWLVWNIHGLSMDAPAWGIARSVAVYPPKARIFS